MAKRKRQKKYEETDGLVALLISKANNSRRPNRYLQGLTDTSRNVVPCGFRSMGSWKWSKNEKPRSQVKARARLLRNRCSPSRLLG